MISQDTGSPFLVSPWICDRFLLKYVRISLYGLPGVTAALTLFQQFILLVAELWPSNYTAPQQQLPLFHNQWSLSLWICSLAFPFPLLFKQFTWLHKPMTPWINPFCVTGKGSVLFCCFFKPSSGAKIWAQQKRCCTWLSPFSLVSLICCLPLWVRVCRSRLKNCGCIAATQERAVSDRQI